MNKTEIEVGKIFNLINGTEGLKICIMESNRNVPSQIKKMQKSIEEIGQQQPGIFTEAVLLYQAGYRLIDVNDGHVITSEEEAAEYVCILDGNTKFHAYQKSAKEGKPFPYKFQYIQYPDVETVKKVYLGINIANTPTRTNDFLRDFLATSNHQYLTMYRDRINNDGLYPKAAAISVFGEELQKKHIVQLRNGETPDIFKDAAKIDRFTKIYEAMREDVKDNPKMYRGTEVWIFIADKMKKADDKDVMADKLIDLFTNLSQRVFKSMQTAKKDGAKSRAQVVYEILDAAMK